MATATETPKRTEHAEQRVVLSGVSWEIFDALTSDDDVKGARLTFDRGVLELMARLPLHEKSKCLLRRFIDVLTEELDIPIMSLGSTTYKRKVLERGFEPDASWYIQHEPDMRGKDEIDFDVDPPPDLIIEVDVTKSALNKLDIFAAFKVPEVWRCNGKQIIVLQLQENGEYEEVERSIAFPFLPLDKYVEFLNRRGQVGETTLVREFRQWVRENLVGPT